ncbi:MAG: DUF5666 domain-containing protein [Ferrimicrobium sp.]|uniref:DUF5666 domain-containing protein n=1 Tax=Ferrimicrobium sp. TaxID=2926050 RepID=UPI00260EAED2|nr:DUF5666 domain-containing protein [Ferrimicrobium sp.]
MKRVKLLHNQGSRRTKGVMVGALAGGSVALIALGFASAGTFATHTTPTSAQLLAAPTASATHYTTAHHRKARGLVGRVIAVTSSTLTVQTRGGVTRSLQLSTSTRYLQGTATVSSGVIRVGTFVRVKTHQSSATVVRILEARTAGVVTSISGGSITITNDHGLTRTLVTSSATAYREAGSVVTPTALRVGELITALGTPQSNGAELDATAIVIALGHFRGTITGINGSVVTLGLAGGTTATVTLSGSTTYRQAGATVSESALTVGQRVVAVGTITGTNAMTAEKVVITRKTPSSSASSLSTPLAIA